MATFFTSLDIYLSAFLSFHGIEPILENRQGKIVFLFENSDELYRCIDRFNNDEAVPVNSFATKVKTLKGKLLTEKENGRANGYGNGGKHGFSSR